MGLLCEGDQKMARISNITVIKMPEVYTLTVRKTIDFMNEYSNFADQTFTKIKKYLENINEILGGEPIVCFHNMDLEKLDVEIGFPVANYINGNGEILGQIIPSQKVVLAIDLGPYEKQDPTLGELFEWIQKNGYEMQGKIYYQYLNNPERNENELLTKMIIPIK
jgi:effector-binding domain-containing protein